MIKIAWFGKHFGEEPPLVGTKSQGAGGIFFCGCNLRCVFCQNFQISQQKEIGKYYSVKELADIALDLEKQGAINIDLISPTIWWQEIKRAVVLAKEKGLSLSIAWNSNGYEKIEMLKEIEGVVDIYLPDFKYGIDEVGEKYSGIENYSRIAQEIIKEMIRQKGNLVIKNGIAQKGVIVRHLVLPNNLKNSKKALEVLASIDKNIHLSLMSQYYPLNNASEYPEINRPLKKEEWQEICDYAISLGFENGWIQDELSNKILIPDFKKISPFSN
jgi:putative pyruvate formate lyase activating enzyme